jgi:membrane protease YdiL (CAAX protease family)
MREMKSRIYNNIVIRIIAGVFLVGGIVFLIQWLSGYFPENLTGDGYIFNLVIAIVQCILAVWCYILLYRYFEKRQIGELSRASFLKNAVPGFLTGIVLQSLIILVLYLAGGYVITRINPALFMVPAFTAALTAGFVAEIIIRGILFRLVEEKLGTVITIGIMMFLFLLMHSGGEGPRMLSALAVSIQAGFLLSAVYVLTRNLWFPIFLHFAWDFAEPGIFGAINPGNSIEKSLFTCQVSGSDILTGGPLGPVNSIQSLILCLLAGMFFLWLARRRKNFIFPYWKAARYH